MATVTVNLRKSSVKDKPGTIYYKVCHQQKRKQITAPIHIYSKDWDAVNRKILTRDDNEQYLQNYSQQIAHDLNVLRGIIYDFEKRNETYTVEQVVSKFYLSPSKVKILEYMQRQITLLRQRGKYGTIYNYRCALHSFAAFLDHQDLPFCMMDEKLIFRYNDWLMNRRLTRNSISFYMRIWRSVYNNAVKEHLVRQTRPFQRVYTGVDTTRKRAVDESTILQLLKMDLSGNLALELSRDLFVFSYCARGMAFVDLAFLRKKDIEGKVLSYHRRKTNQLLTVRIEPCLAHIIAKYESRTHDSPFVFPILDAETEAERYQQYHTALCYHNRKLKKISEMAGIQLNLSSYTSRHTWATTARNHNVPLSVISAGMGHKSEKTTEIYLASLDNSIIDDANSGLLTEINKEISF